MNPSTTVMPKLTGMPVFFMKYCHRVPGELIAGHRLQAGLRFDPPAHLLEPTPGCGLASTNDITLRSGGTN